jgi:diguanylate cyclase (GGDEF)-like protein
LPFGSRSYAIWDENELEFLTWLAQQPREVLFTSTLTPQDCFGLGVNRFRDMVLGLLDEGCLNGTPQLPWGDSQGWQHRTLSVTESFNALVARQPARLALNHRGWLRLARLQDELRANRISERFGILLDQRHWRRDTTIAMLNASEQHPVALVLADLDHFKAVNDQIGYEHGDQCLRKYFAIARELLGEEGDLYCRGGDEILAIFEGIGLDRASKLAEALRSGVQSAFARPEANGLNPITMSCGVSVFTSAVTPDAASKVVTDLLHRAKNRGRNRVEVG